eukprot:scaffold16670_cov110-Isochrysis_galbana.AAC.7
MALRWGRRPPECLAAKAVLREASSPPLFPPYLLMLQPYCLGPRPSPRGEWDDSGTAPPPSHGYLPGCRGEMVAAAARLQPPSLAGD